MTTKPRPTDREVFWMSRAMINARYDTGRFSALTGLVRDWPETKLCELASRLSGWPPRSREAAINTINGFRGALPQTPDTPLHVHDAQLEHKILRVVEELDAPET